MARYKNREVTIETYPTEQYNVVIVHKEDGTKETVPLSQVTLNKHEAMEFLKAETAKIENKKLVDDKANAEHEKHTKKVVPKPVTTAPTDVEAKTVSMNPFSRKAAI